MEVPARPAPGRDRRQRRDSVAMDHFRSRQQPALRGGIPMQRTERMNSPIRIRDLSQLASGLSEGEFNGLQSADMFRKTLERERARADRTGDPLAVISFHPPAGDPNWDLLAGILCERLRTTDEAGWLDDGRICTVLPGTPPEGAWKVANDVFQVFPDDMSLPTCTIYTYPSHGLSVPAGTAGERTLGDREFSALEPFFLKPMPTWKRTLDVLGAGFGLVLLAPLLPVVALTIKLSSRGPVFFTQRRSGWGGRPFQMWKFRTMVVEAEAKKDELLALNEQDGPAFKIKKDPRVTPIGRLLRKTSIDELPQLWNVLRGHMSLVGPRPLPCAESDNCEAWHRRRLDVVPGLTCIWQVKGRSSVTFAEWVRMDVEYIRRQSLGQDLKLICLTVPALLLRRGAH